MTARGNTLLPGTIKVENRQYHVHDHGLLSGRGRYEDDQRWGWDGRPHENRRYDDDCRCNDDRRHEDLAFVTISTASSLYFSAYGRQWYALLP